MALETLTLTPSPSVPVKTGPRTIIQVSGERDFTMRRGFATAAAAVLLLLVILARTTTTTGSNAPQSVKPCYSVRPGKPVPIGWIDPESGTFVPWNPTDSTITPPELQSWPDSVWCP